MEQAPVSYSPEQVNYGLRQFSTSTQDTVYKVGKAKIFALLETMFDDPLSHRLRALKGMAADALLDIQHRIMEVESIFKVLVSGGSIQTDNPFINGPNDN